MQPRRAAYRVSLQLGFSASLVVAKNPRISLA